MILFETGWEGSWTIEAISFGACEMMTSSFSFASQHSLQSSLSVRSETDVDDTGRGLQLLGERQDKRRDGFCSMNDENKIGVGSNGRREYNGNPFVCVENQTRLEGGLRRCFKDSIHNRTLIPRRNIRQTLLHQIASFYRAYNLRCLVLKIT